ALVVIAAVYVVRVWSHARAGGGLPHFDTYAYFYPNERYALDSLRSGHGLLWNRFQSCGEPFFAVSTSALLYPVQVLLLVLDVHRFLLAIFFLHLVLGGAGSYALGRALGFGPAAALSGALAFELGANTMWSGYWSPTILIVYCWMPVALALVERLIGRPSA